MASSRVPANLQSDESRPRLCSVKAVETPEQHIIPKPDLELANRIRQLCRIAVDIYPILGVTELLRQILVNLQCPDLLLGARLIGRFWKECMEGSVKLEKKSFRIQDSETEEDEQYKYSDNPEIDRRGDSETGLRLTRLRHKGQWKTTDL